VKSIIRVTNDGTSRVRLCLPTAGDFFSFSYYGNAHASINVLVSGDFGVGFLPLLCKQGSQTSFFSKEMLVSLPRRVLRLIPPPRTEKVCLDRYALASTSAIRTSRMMQSVPRAQRPRIKSPPRSCSLRLLRKRRLTEFSLFFGPISIPRWDWYDLGSEVAQFVSDLIVA
jgi:hypothetical protein